MLSRLACAALLAPAAALPQQYGAYRPYTPQRSTPVTYTSQHTIAEQYLFQSINAERAANGLPPLQWNPSLTRAAASHAIQMLNARAISHQFRGEPDLTARAASAGARFSRVAENVAVSPSVLQMHTALMNSPHHRDNILDPAVNTIGISVISSGTELWGVEDFAKDVQSLTYQQQEQQVAQLLARYGLDNITTSQTARANCRMSTGYTGTRPAFIMRYTASDLDRLPSQLTARIAQGGFRSAEIGACETQERSNFTAYNIAVVLYR